MSQVLSCLIFRSVISSYYSPKEATQTTKQREVNVCSTLSVTRSSKSISVCNPCQGRVGESVLSIQLLVIPITPPPGTQTYFLGPYTAQGQQP